MTRTKQCAVLLLMAVLAAVGVASRLYLDRQFEELIPQEGIETGFFDTLVLDAAVTVQGEYLSGEVVDGE